MPNLPNVAGLYRQEIDLSQTATSAGTSVGALVVRAPQGRVNTDVVVSNYDEYVSNFGNVQFTTSSASDTLTPPVNGYGAFTAKYFLSESSELHVVRICDSTDLYPNAMFSSACSAASNVSAYPITAVSAYSLSASMDSSNPDTLTKIAQIDSSLLSTDYMVVSHVGPGTNGQNFAVTLETFNMSADWLFSYDPWSSNPSAAAIELSASQGLVPSVMAFDLALSTYGLASSAALPIAYKTVKLKVYQKSSKDSWSVINKAINANTYNVSAMSPIATYYGTMGHVTDMAGNQLKLTTVINGIDQNIYVATGTRDLPYEIVPKYFFPLIGGAVSSITSGLGASDTYASSAWNFFANREFASVNILCNADWDTTVKQNVAKIAATRMDCIATGQSGKITDITTAGVIQQEQYGYKDASYMALYAGWDLVNEPVNGRSLYIPKACFAGMLMARNDNTGNTWDAPAGIPNGVLPSLGQYHTFSFTEIGQLNSNNINTSRWMKATGHVMWAYATAQLANTARNRISTRRLLIYVENSLEQTFNPFLFNITNDARNRDRIATLGNMFLSTVTVGTKPGAENALCVCNDKNNPQIVIDNHQLVVDIYIQPAMIVERILLRAFIVNGSINWQELTA